MPSRRTVILVAAAIGGLALAGLIVPGRIGGALLIAVALLLTALTTLVHTQSQTSAGRGFDSRNWALRGFVIVALAGIGLVKLFGH